MLIVKDNHPTLRADIQTLFAAPPPGEPIMGAEQTSRHGGRLEVRRLARSAALVGYLDWPGVGLVGEEQCAVTCPGQTTISTRTVLTSRPADTPAADVRRFVRGHWQVENRRHWVRDVTMQEDGRRWRASAAPHIIAALRTVVLAILRAVKVPNIAAARRTLARQCTGLRLLGWHQEDN